MAKDPAMLWYWSDWYSGTSTMTRFMKGCYMDVLHAQFNNGRLSLEEIRTVLGSDFGQAWPTLQKKFAADPAGKYFNERLEHEQLKRAAFTASRRKNLQSTHMEPHMHQHMVSHMENVNEDESIDVVKVDRGYGGKKDSVADVLFSDKRFVEMLQMTHKGKDLRQAFDECFIYHSNSPNPPTELWQWRQKLNTWLSIKQPEKAAPKKKMSYDELTEQ